MFQLKVLSHHEPLLLYLRNESRPLGADTFGFSSREKAVSLLSEFVLFHLIEQKTDEFVRLDYIKEEERKDLPLFYADYDVRSYTRPIAEELSFHLSNHQRFHLFGLVRFGLKDTQKELYNILYASLYAFYEHKKVHGSLSWIEEYFHRQTPKHESLSLVVHPNGDASLMDGGTVLFRDAYRNHYSVIGHAIDERPKSLKVYDEHHLLQKEFVIMLRKLFRSKVEFRDEPYAEDCHL
jgi:hypothetical protein